MNKKIVIATTTSLVVTGVLMFGIITVAKNISKPKETIEVACATKEIKAGMTLQSDMYTYKSIPKDEDNPQYVHKQRVDNKGKIEYVDPILGKVTSTIIYNGEKIIDARVEGVKQTNGGNTDASTVNTNLRKMTYTAQGINNLAGQLKPGDKVDFWIRYKLQQKDTNDTIIVVDKILENVPIVKALDGNSEEIKGNNAPSTTIEILLPQDQIQDFIKWRDLGNITLVKVPADADTSKEKKINRIRMSMNDLSQEVLSMKNDAMDRKDIVKDPAKKAISDTYKVVENENK